MKRLLAILLFEDSRKVAFGFYLFIFSNLFLAFGRINGSEWFMAVSLCAALIGGGTVLDEYLRGKNVPLTGPKKPE